MSYTWCCVVARSKQARCFRTDTGTLTVPVENSLKGATPFPGLALQLQGLENILSSGGVMDVLIGCGQILPPP